jgi:hypothetical protein
VTIYTRPGCGLCEEATRVVAAVRDRLAARMRADAPGSPGATEPFSVEEVDISGDDTLELRYGIRIPVVEVDGAELFELTVDADALAAVVAR